MAIIAYADIIDAQPLPIDAQDVLTNPILVIAGTVSGATPHSVRTLHRTDPTSGGAADNTPVTFRPLPIVHMNADAKHAAYQASRGVEWPPGSNPWVTPENLAAGVEPVATGITNAGTPSAVRDGDAATYASSDLSDDATLEYGGNISPTRQVAASWDTAEGLAGQTVGFRLRYSLSSVSTGDLGTPANIHLMHMSRHYNTAASFEEDYVTIYRWDLTATEDIDTIVEVVGIAPFDARAHPDNADSLDESALTHEYGTYLELFVHDSSGGALRVFDFYPLVIDSGAADAVAARTVRLPASTPKRVTVNKYVAPDSSHTIAGWLGGDYTGVAARHTYGGGVTTIDFEQAGSPQAEAQAAIEAERARRRLEALRRDAALYNLTLGERQ